NARLPSHDQHQIVSARMYGALCRAAGGGERCDSLCLHRGPRVCLRLLQAGDLVLPAPGCCQNQHFAYRIDLRELSSLNLGEGTEFGRTSGRGCFDQLFMSEAIMAKMIRIERTSCPCCDTMLDGIEPIDGAPVFGAVPVTLTVCNCCGHLMTV